MKRKFVKRLASLSVAGAMFVCLPMTALADTYDVSNGNIYVDASLVNGEVKYNVKINDVDQGAPSDNSVIITGQDISLGGYNSGGYVIIHSRSGANALITLRNLTIDHSDSRTHAVLTNGGGTVTIELDGNNYLAGGADFAGLGKENGGSLIIKDDNNVSGKLEAVGGENGAGIGGYHASASGETDGTNIIIKGGTIIAKGGECGSGIGGGVLGRGENIAIEGGDVTAIGGKNGAGIGGGLYNFGNNITIEGGDVTATGGESAAGIGGGNGGSAQDITIKGGTVTATGGKYGAGIGGGAGAITVANKGMGKNITIEGGTVTATGGEYGAGIGGGYNSSGENITIKGGEVTATGGEGGAGIGGGESAAGEVKILGGTVEATGGECGAGIGGGISGAGVVEINGGNVIAVGTPGSAGIGSGFDNQNASITISGNAVVSAAGGMGVYCNGAAIGTGGGLDANSGERYNGTEQDLDLSNLYTTGSVTKFAAGTTVDGIKDHPELGTKVAGTKPDPNAPTNTTTVDSSTTEKTVKTSSEEPKKPLPEKSFLHTPSVHAWLT
jgi:hypothetical protein